MLEGGNPFSFCTQLRALFGVNQDGEKEKDVICFGGTLLCDLHLVLGCW